MASLSPAGPYRTHFLNHPLPALYAISDSRWAEGRSHAEIVNEFLEGGARWIQIREKEAASGRFLAEARVCAELARRKGALLFINDRPDIAWLAGAAGVHIGREDLPAGTIRGELSGRLRIGQSTHSAAEALRHHGDVDYVAIGPILPSPTAKRGWKPLGPEVLHQLRGRLAVPLIAIGGIRLTTAASILEAGADGIAVISDLLQASSIRRRVREFLELIRTVRRGRGSESD